MIYKPLSGALSDDEYAILDEINGLVLAGEIALERLQRAVESRAAKQGQEFENHYELAAYLLAKVRAMYPTSQEPIMGRADVLLEFLKNANLNSPELIESFVQ